MAFVGLMRFYRAVKWTQHFLTTLETASYRQHVAIVGCSLLKHFSVCIVEFIFIKKIRSEYNLRFKWCNLHRRDPVSEFVSDIIILSLEVSFYVWNCDGSFLYFKWK